MVMTLLVFLLIGSGFVLGRLTVKKDDKTMKPMHRPRIRK